MMVLVVLLHKKSKIRLSMYVRKNIEESAGCTEAHIKNAVRTLST